MPPPRALRPPFIATTMTTASLALTSVATSHHDPASVLDAHTADARGLLSPASVTPQHRSSLRPRWPSLCHPSSQLHCADSSPTLVEAALPVNHAIAPKPWDLLDRSAPCPPWQPAVAAVTASVEPLGVCSTSTHVVIHRLIIDVCGRRDLNFLCVRDRSTAARAIMPALHAAP